MTAVFSRPWASLRAPRGHRRENKGDGLGQWMQQQMDLTLDTMTTSYFLSRSTIVSTQGNGMASAADFLRLPPNRVVELGTKVRI